MKPALARVGIVYTVRCEICGLVPMGRGALWHKNRTGHNCWELLTPITNKGG